MCLYQFAGAGQVVRLQQLAAARAASLQRRVGRDVDVPLVARARAAALPAERRRAAALHPHPAARAARLRHQRQIQRLHLLQ